jgi:hypothetical protein
MFLLCDNQSRLKHPEREGNPVNLIVSANPKAWQAFFIELME